jgi:hypothetical protein
VDSSDDVDYDGEEEDNSDEAAAFKGQPKNFFDNFKSRPKF